MVAKLAPHTTAPPHILVRCCSGVEVGVAAGTFELVASADTVSGQRTIPPKSLTSHSRSVCPAATFCSALPYALTVTSPALAR